MALKHNMTGATCAMCQFVDDTFCNVANFVAVFFFVVVLGFCFVLFVFVFVLLNGTCFSNNDFAVIVLYKMLRF